MSPEGQFLARHSKCSPSLARVTGSNCLLGNPGLCVSNFYPEMSPLSPGETSVSYEIQPHTPAPLFLTVSKVRREKYSRSCGDYTPLRGGIKMPAIQKSNNPHGFQLKVRQLSTLSFYLNTKAQTCKRNRSLVSKCQL